MSKCKQCGGAINWVKKDGRWHGLNPDGSDHWDTCSKVRWRQVEATGERFERESGLTSADVNAKLDGYRNSKHGTKLSRAAIPPIRGKNYADPKCDCGVPPWVECKHTPKEWR